MDLLENMEVWSISQHKQEQIKQIKKQKAIREVANFLSILKSRNDLFHVIFGRYYK